MKYLDISPKISSRLGVFPGDTQFSRSVALDFQKGHNLALSAMTTTLHLGAHADSPSHYHKDGVGIDQLDLFPYFGPCQVIEAHVERGKRIHPQHLKSAVESPRILLKTESFPNPEEWNSDFCSLSPELVDYFANSGVLLVGIDTPSVDPETSKDLPSHNALYRNNMRVLEGIILAHVTPGHYTLVALPLAIENADASPVRAILLPADAIRN